MSTSNFFFELVTGLGQLKAKSDRALRSRARPKQCALFCFCFFFFYCFFDDRRTVRIFFNSKRGARNWESLSLDLNRSWPAEAQVVRCDTGAVERIAQIWQRCAGKVSLITASLASTIRSSVGRIHVTWASFANGLCHRRIVTGR